MAIYHLHTKVFTKAKGHNIVKSIAYRRGAKLMGPITGEIYDYSHKKNVVHSEIMISQDAPQWIKDLVELEKTQPDAAAQLFANSIELREKRVNAQLAREIEVSLPIELTKEQNLLLCRDFIANFIEQGMVAEFNIHWEDGNPHAHIILSMRELVEDGWGKKARRWNKKQFINRSRELWAEKLNNHLKMAEFEITVSHLSNYDLGIDQEATIHMGNHKNSNQQAREQNQKIHLVNLNKIIDNTEIIFDKLSLQQSAFTLKDVAKALGTQLDPADVNNIRDLGVINFDGTAALNLNLAPAMEDTAPANIQEAALPLIEILPNYTPSQVVEQVLAEITKSESVFTERYLTHVLAKHIKNPAEVAKILLDLRGSTSLISIGFGEDGRERFTTRDLFNIENELQDLAVELSVKAEHKIAGKLINKCLQEFNLKDDQADAIRFILKGQDLSCIVGRAGTGKSYSLKAARWAWERSGFMVYGVALAGIAAQNLEQDSGIKSQTIESFNYAILNEKLTLSHKDIIVMDEAGMTDSISMSKVMLAVKQAGAKLVLIGDHAQLQPVGPGAIFRSLLERVGFAELTTIRRQKEAWQREATGHFAAGNTEKALGLYQEHSQIHLSKSRATALELLVNDWYKATLQSSLADNLMQAYLNEDVEELNKLAREKIILQGGLPQSYAIQANKQTLQVAIGERIIFLENNWRYQVKNGQRATITGIGIDDQEQVNMLEVRLDGKENKTVAIDPAKYNKFSYGYACTVHRSQGVTVQNSFVLALGRWCKNLTYVAMTRHQGSVTIYASEETYRTVEELKKGLSKHRIKDSVLDYPEAFAERRGIDCQEPNNIILLQRHIVKKLTALKQKFADTYERLITPQAYFNRIEYQNKVAQILQRREDAKLVAAYVDAHHQVGKAWAEFKASNDHLEYREIFNQAQILRNSIAAEIYKDLSKYTVAIEICDLEVENLAKQAKQHELRLQVLNYIDKSKFSVLRDRLAYEIKNNIKAYYPYLQNENVDLKRLEEQSEAHRRRLFLVKMSLEQRRAFRQVEEYIKLCKRSAELWWKHNEEVKQERSTTQEISKTQSVGLAINLERDRLAFVIKQDQALYQASLDYFEFGAKSRTILPTTTEYQASIGMSVVELALDEKNLCNAVALYLDQHVKAFRSTVIVDLKYNTEAQQLFELPAGQTIEDYIEDHKNLNQPINLDLTTLSKLLNRQIVTIGTDGKIFDPEVLAKPYDGEPIFVYRDHENNYHGMVLAVGSTGPKVLAKLQREMQREQWSEDRLNRLEKYAENYRLRLQVLDYIEKSKFLMLRDRLAYEIKNNIKAYYPYLKSEDVDLKKLEGQSEAYRRRLFLLKMSLVQRRAFGQVEKYIKLAKRSSELWCKYREILKKDQTATRQVSKTQAMGVAINQERDRLAFVIKQDPSLYQASLDYFEFGAKSRTIVPTTTEYPASIGLSVVELAPNLCNAVALYLNQEMKAQELIRSPDDQKIENYIQDPNQFVELDLTTLSKLLNRQIVTIGTDGKILDPEGLAKPYAGEPIFVYRDHENNYHGIALAVGSTGTKVLAKLQREMQREQWSEDRLNRLEKYAENYRLRLQVLNYIEKSKFSMLRDRLAYEIKNNIKAYYPYLKSEDVDLKKLEEQSEAYRRKLFLLKMSLEQRKAFRQVEKYIKLSKKAAILWGQKREGSISALVLRQGLRFNQERDLLAYTIKQNLSLYQASLDYFKIGTIDNTISEAKMRLLESRALAFKRKKDLEENFIKFKKNIGNFVIRRLIAKDIVATPKYYHMVKDAKIDANILLKYANYQQKIEMLETLSLVERRALIAVTNYKYVRRQAGKLWKEIFAQKNQGLPVEQKVFDRAIHLNMERNKLAYIIDLNSDLYEQFLLSEKIQTKDLKKHAQSYEKQFHLKQLASRENKLLARDVKGHHRHSLEQIYLKPREFSDEQLKKQEYAQEIVGNSVPIEGTLAEKYLKEHRGLTGAMLSDQVFRFNPGVKERQTQKEWPALVVIARDQRQEIQSVQCIYLDPKTSNQLEVAVPKRTYGPQDGAKILVQHCKFVPNAYHNYALTYGPETALSIAEADRDLGVYLTLAANFANVPISTGCIDLLLCVDQDGCDSFANKNLDHAIQALAERGLNVYCARPTDVKDFNEVMKIHGAARVKQLLDDRKLVKEAVKLEQLIANKDRLVSDYAKVMVDFVIKHQEYKNREEPKSVKDVKYNHDLFKQVGEIASFIKNNGIFAEICERHQLADQVAKIEKQYVKAQKIELEVARVLKELGTQDLVKDYIKVIENKDQLADLGDSLSARKAINNLTEQAMKCAYVIQNTPTLQYEVQDLACYSQIELHASEYQRKIAMINEINLDMGVGWGDD